MRLTRAVVLAAVAAAGCDNAIQMSLVAPAGATCDLDYSCATHVLVTAYGNDPTDAPSTCVAIPPGTVRSLADNGLGGLVQLALPASGLKFVEVRIVASPFGDCSFADTLAYGVGHDDGTGHVAIALACSLDCAARAPASRPVQVYDLTTLLDTGTCAPAEGGQPMQMDVGVARPTGSTDELALTTSWYEPFADPPPATLDASGQGEIDGTIFSQVADHSCFAASAYDDTATGLPSASCLNPGGGTVCAPYGRLELGFLSVDTANAAVDPTQLDDWGSMSLVVAWDAAAHQPIAGAQVAFAGADDGAVAYLDRVAGGFTPRGDGKTGASGVATVYAAGPVPVTISAPGYAARTVWVGGDSALPSGQAVPLVHR